MRPSAFARCSVDDVLGLGGHQHFRMLRGLLASRLPPLQQRMGGDSE